MQVLVPLPTLLGLREDTAELRGYGDIPAEVARELAADADWQRWTYDPVDGHLLDLGKNPVPTTRTTPAVPDRPRQTLPVPGFSRREPSTATATTPTRTTRPGTAKAAPRPPPGWPCCPDHRTGPRPTPTSQLRHDPDGTLTWTTPLGRQYQTRPWDYRPDSDKP